jgi:hypothetical protein
MRRHREDALIPTLLMPVDLPEDAQGRIEVVRWTVPEEPISPDQSLRVPAPPPAKAVKVQGDLLPPGVKGWIPVLMLAVILALAFAVGLRVTH